MIDLTIESWQRATATERRAGLDARCAARDDLRVVHVDDVAVLHHAPSGLVFHLVPGGVLRMGIGPDEHARLRAQYQYWDGANEADQVLSAGHSAPVIEVTLRPFLLAAHPLGRAQPRSYDELVSLPADRYLAYLTTFEAEGLTLAQARERERELARVGLRLPSEAEWEWAARAGTARSFPAGDEIPRTPATGRNPLGFVDLGAQAELCADGWAPTLADTPRDGRPRAGDGRVVRGGGATCYPWQDCGEWTYLLCGARGPVGEMDGMLALRPAMELP